MVIHLRDEKYQVFMCMVKYFAVDSQLSERFFEKSSTFRWNNESYKPGEYCLET